MIFGVITNIKRKWHIHKAQARVFCGVQKNGHFVTRFASMCSQATDPYGPSRVNFERLGPQLAPTLFGLVWHMSQTRSTARVFSGLQKLFIL